MPRRVAVTGLGAVTPLGGSIEATWAGLLAGRCAVSQPSGQAPALSGCGYLAAVPDDGWDAALPAREAKWMDRYLKLAIAAAQMAVVDSGLPPESLVQASVYIGTASGGISKLCGETVAKAISASHRVSPLTIPFSMPDMAAAYLCMQLGIQGPSMSVSTACASGATAIGEAYNAIRFGLCSNAIAGGADALSDPMALGFQAARVLATGFSEPQQASRPFDRCRNGFVLAEGACWLVLEELEQARERGARIYGEILGYGATSDAYHLTTPKPDASGALAAIRQACKSLGDRQVTYVNAHATSTLEGDISEARAIQLAFPQEPPLVSSIKGMTGHMLGGSGALEAAVCVLAIRDKLVPATINLENVGAGCELNHVTESIEHEPDAVISNSFGFGGHNVTLAMAEAGG